MMNKNFLCRISVIFVFCCGLISVALANIVSVTKNDIDGGIDIITPYGYYFENDPLIIELIYSGVMQRLHDIMQYGPGDKVERASLYAGLLDDEVLASLKKAGRLNPEVTKENLCYSRFDHSICTYVLYARKGRPRKEKIGGLKHDASHSAFSHVGDVIGYGNVTHEISHQDMNLLNFLEQHGVGDVLKKYDMTLTDLTSFDDREVLWRKKPYLDRVDYTVVGGLLAGKLPLKTFDYIVDNIHFHEGKKFWYFATESSADAFMKVYINLGKLNMFAPWNTIVNAYVGMAVATAIDLGSFSQEDFDYNKKDSEIWKFLEDSMDVTIQRCMKIVQNHNSYIKRYACSNGSPLRDSDRGSYKWVRPKFREFDPYVKTNRQFIPFSQCVSQLLYDTQLQYGDLARDTKRGLLINFKNFSIKPVKGNVLNGH